MRVVWFFLGASALMIFTGLLARSILQPAHDSLATSLTNRNVVQNVENVELEMPTDMIANNERQLVDEERATESIAELPPPSSSTVVGTVLFDYDENDPAWYVVNDDVMGGVSTSEVSTDTTTQRLTFTGNLSLENNGGFASARSQWVDYDLTGYDGIVLRVRGDGKTYQFRIRAEETGSEIAYAALLETEAGSWKDIYIPFTEMIPIYRGVIVRSAPALDPGSIRSFGLMLANKQQGEFLLEVEMITAVVAGNQQI